MTTSCPVLAWLAVAAGGAIGSLARWQLGQLVQASGPGLRFPVATLLVNLLGCLAIGTLAGLFERSWAGNDPMRLLLFTGLLGGFTTFSAFGLETIELLRRGAPLMAASYIAASVLGGLVAVWLGLTVART